MVLKDGRSAGIVGKVSAGERGAGEGAIFGFGWGWVLLWCGLGKKIQ